MKAKKGCTIWLTGLSGSGKSTLANTLKTKLKNMDQSLALELLDGDELREHLCKDLSFSREDRFKNIERIAFLAGKLSKHGVIVLVPVIAPYEEARKIARSLSDNFIEIYVKASIETVSKRDVKGLYAKAIKGEIKNFTGISDPYEEPSNPDLVINTEESSIDDSINKLVSFLSEKEVI